MYLTVPSCFPAMRTSAPSFRPTTFWNSAFTRKVDPNSSLLLPIRKTPVAKIRHVAMINSPNRNVLDISFTSRPRARIARQTYSGFFAGPRRFPQLGFFLHGLQSCDLQTTSRHGHHGSPQSLSFRDLSSTAGLVLRFPSR